MANESVEEVLKAFLGQEKGAKTFKRWYQWLTEIFSRDATYIESCFNAIEQSTYDQIITVKDIEVDLTCPHHLLPVEMLVHIGYKPAGKILGLSKFARVAKEMAKPPVTQEQYVQDLLSVFDKKLDPKFIIVLAEGKHSCMRCRGVRSRSSVVVTSALNARYGSQLGIESLKEEVMRLVLK